MKGGKRFNFRKMVSSPVTIVILLILAFILGRAAWNMHRNEEATAERLSQAQAGLEQLEGQQASLSQAISSISTDQGMEMELRAKYRAVLPGESVAVIIDNSPTTSATDTPASIQNMSWWGRVLRLIGL